MSRKNDIQAIIAAQPVNEKDLDAVTGRLQSLSARDLRLARAAIEKLGKNAPRITNLFRNRRLFRDRVDDLIERSGVIGG